MDEAAGIAIQSTIKMSTMGKNQAQNGQDQYAQAENGQANQNGRCVNSVHHLAIHPIVGVGGSAGEGGLCTVGSGGTRTVIHFCISKTEHCIRTPHVSVIFDGVIVARKYPFVKTARLIKYAAR